jgi:hypothetical protein
MEERMRRFWYIITDWTPTWEAFLLYIGGIPTLITAAVVAFMAIWTTRNKAFSLKQYNHLRASNTMLQRKELDLVHKLHRTPPFIRWVYRKWIGEINYHDLINNKR